MRGRSGQRRVGGRRWWDADYDVAIHGADAGDLGTGVSDQGGKQQGEGGKRMEWYAYLAYLFAGAFLANGVPHFVHGIAGERFQSPFASPPGIGESPALVNVVWGLVNFAAGYVLIFEVGDFVFGLTRGSFMVGLGALLISVGLSLYFGRIRNR